VRLKELQQTWDRFGKTDAMWAIIVDPERSGNRWNAKEFFDSGNIDAQELLDDLAQASAEVARGRCLDFGCGVGRVTQALCEHFQECDGVDIAPSMISGANEYNRHGSRCRYLLNETDDLSVFGDRSFDCVYSLLVLQHMDPDYSKRYIGEFIRVLKPGGVAYFQIPAARRTSVDSAGRARLPAGTHRARISLLDGPSRLRSMELATVKVCVANAGAVTWPAGEAVRLGNHWRKNGKVAALDDGRAGLPRDLHPQEELILHLEVQAPGTGAMYELELDMVEEGVSWFADAGSGTSRTPVRVLPSAASLKGGVRRAISAMRTRLPAVPKPEADQEAEGATMEMHCVPMQEVIDCVGKAGGEVRDVARMDKCGPDFESYRYIAVRL
jgi:hypothetical protein